MCDSTSVVLEIDKSKNYWEVSIDPRRLFLFNRPIKWTRRNWNSQKRMNIEWSFRFRERKSSLNDQKKPRKQTMGRWILRLLFIFVVWISSGIQVIVLVGRVSKFYERSLVLRHRDIILLRPVTYLYMRRGSKSLIAARYFIFRFSSWTSSLLIIESTTK